MNGLTVDVRALAEALLAQLDSDHIARREGVILLHNSIMAEVAKLNPPAETVSATAEVAVEPAATP